VDARGARRFRDDRVIEERAPISVAFKLFQPISNFVLNPASRLLTVVTRSPVMPAEIVACPKSMLSSLPLSKRQEP
jgi:hypothetical protein